MANASFDDVRAFLVVAKEQNFTRAAAKLGISQSALSHKVRGLEERLGLRLLTRTTRSVAATEAGERLRLVAEPRFEEVDAEIEALVDAVDKPVGTVRITAAEHAVRTVLWPKLANLLADNAGIKVEINIDYGLRDIVAQRYDAGVRLGEHVEKDMIAVRIGPDMRMAVVGSPLYFVGRKLPEVPQDLIEHDCINMRFPTYGGLYAWEFEKDGQEVNVRVEGQLVFNSSTPILSAALAGRGLGFLPEDMVAAAIAARGLVRVLKDWCEPFAGYHLYYPKSRQSSGALAAITDVLRYRP